MPKITLSKTVSRTYNLGDYENYKPSYTITKEFDENENIDIEKELQDMTLILDLELQNERKKIGR